MFTIKEYLNSLKSDKSKLVTNLNEKGVEASNDETFTTLVPKVSEIISGADLSEYFEETIQNGGYVSANIRPGFVYSIKKIPEDLVINTTTANYLFCTFNGAELPLIDTSNVVQFNNAFSECTNLTTIPIYDTSKANSLSNMFMATDNLNDTSLDNILQMCINAVLYNGTKTLYQLGLRSNAYSVSRIQALPHYQDFINAGWTIGY